MRIYLIFFCYPPNSGYRKEIICFSILMIDYVELNVRPIWTRRTLWSGLDDWSMAEFTSDQRFTAICGWYLQEWPLWKSDEQSRMTACYIAECHPTPAAVGNAGWSTSGKLLLTDMCPGLYCCFLIGQHQVVWLWVVKVYVLILHTFKARWFLYPQSFFFSLWTVLCL